MLALRLLLVVPSLAVALASQATLTVGPGGYPEIADALAAAQAGDTIVVQPGNYTSFDLTIGVNIIAPGGATVIPPALLGQWNYTNLEPQAGQTALIMGLTFASQGANEPHTVTVHDGAVILDQCTFRGGYPAKVLAGLTVLDGNVMMRACSFPVHTRGLKVHGGSVLVSDCFFTGSDISSIYYEIPCLHLLGGRCNMTFSELRGAPTAGTDEGSPAVILENAAELIMSDCRLFGGDSYPMASPVVPAVSNGSTVPVRHDRCQVVGGTGYLSAWPTIWPILGPSFVGPEVTAPLVGAVGHHDGLLVGSPYSMLCRTQPLDLVAIGYTNSLTPPQLLPGFEGTTRFDPQTVTIFTSGWGGSAGAFGFSVPNIPSSLAGETVWLHPVTFDGVVLRAGPVVGGLIR